MVVENMPHAEYHAGHDDAPPLLSASIARILIAESPRHAWLEHPRLGGQRRKPTRTMDRGSMLHQLCLGGDLGVHIVQATHPKTGEIVEDYRTRAAQEERDAAQADGKVVMLQRELEPLQAFAEDTCQALRDRYLLNLDDGQTELSVFFDTDGVRCKARLDHFHDAMISDLKFCESANPKKLASVIYNFGYDIEMAAHTEAIETEMPALAGRVQSRLVFVESPELITIVPMTGAWRELGQWRWQRAKEIWRECIEKNEWPGYSQTTIDPPVYALQQMIEAA